MNNNNYISLNIPTDAIAKGLADHFEYGDLEPDQIADLIEEAILDTPSLKQAIKESLETAFYDGEGADWMYQAVAELTKNLETLQEEVGQEIQQPTKDIQHEINLYNESPIEADPAHLSANQLGINTRSWS